MYIIPFLALYLLRISAEGNANLDLEEWELAEFPSPYPTPWMEHPRNTPPPTVSPKPTTSLPTSAPSHKPSKRPTYRPTPSPSVNPATAPTYYPSYSPTTYPTKKPTPFPSLPNHIGSSHPTPTPTLQPGSLMMDYILFGASVTLADMMVITATLWGAIFVLGLTYIYRNSILGNKDTSTIRLDPDISIHSDVSLSQHSEYRGGGGGPVVYYLMCMFCA